MTACCCSGYRPLRGIRLDECNWPPRLAPAGPWEICNCAEGVALAERLAAMAASKAGLDTPPLPISGDGVKFAVLFHDPPVCSTCPETAQPEPVIEWHEHWRTWLCPECGSVLAEEKP